MYCTVVTLHEHSHVDSRKIVVDVGIVIQYVCCLLFVLHGDDMIIMSRGGPVVIVPLLQYSNIRIVLMYCVSMMIIFN